jgi:hypothetical protein
MWLKTCRNAPVIEWSRQRRLTRRSGCAVGRVLLVIVAATPSLAADGDAAPAVATPAVAAAREPAATPGASGAAVCRCDRFAEELPAAEALFASRGDGVALPLTDAMHRAFRERVDRAYAHARCLAGCQSAPPPARNRARALTAMTGFKTLGLAEPVARERLEVAVAETERCLAAAPGDPPCHLWHASARGILARGSWNPLDLRLVSELLAEFRAARAGAAPGTDVPDGAATRGEAWLLLRAPAFVGGDRAAARRLMEEAASAPHFACVLSNRLLLAATRALTGAVGESMAELRASIAAGLPSCSDRRYENALGLDEARRCLARLEAAPDADPGWNDDCQ